MGKGWKNGGRTYAVGKPETDAELAARVGIDVTAVYDRSTRRCQLSGWMVQDHGDGARLAALRAAELEHAYGAEAAGVTP